MTRAAIPYPIPEDELREAIRGVPNHLLAARYGISPSTIWNWKRRLGVPNLRRGPIPTPAQDKILALLAQYPGGLLGTEITRRTGVTKQAVSLVLHILLRHGDVTWRPVHLLNRTGASQAKRWFLTKDTPEALDGSPDHPARRYWWSLDTHQPIDEEP